MSPLEVGQESIPSVWAGFLKPIPCDEMPCSALMGGGVACYCLTCMCQSLWTTHRRCYAFQRVDGMGLGKERREGRRGRCGWYVKWIQKNPHDLSTCKAEIWFSWACITISESYCVFTQILDTQELCLSDITTPCLWDNLRLIFWKA